MNATRLDDRGVIESCPHCGQKNRVSFGALGNVVRCGSCRTELPSLTSAIEIDDQDTFESFTETSRLPVLVDFWADWCGPCKMMAPELKRVATHSSGKFVVAKVNTEGLPILAQRHGISAIPTLVLFAGGRELTRIQGARAASEI